MSTEDDSYVSLREFILHRISFGFDEEADIVEDALEQFKDEMNLQILETRAKEITHMELIAHIQSQRDWLTQTDCDRLDEVFDNLENKGILARQNFTCCQSCGHEEIWEEIEFSKLDNPIVGYVFYHMQDTERAYEEGRLFIAYGSVENDDESAIKIAKELVKELQKIQFSVDWNGSIEKRVCIPKFVWKKRRST